LRVGRPSWRRLGVEALEERLAPALVAAYAFDEGTGTTVADASGNAHTGTIANATWSPSGKYGDALSFNGTNARVNVPDATSLHLTTGMTLEAWVEPTAAAKSWQDVIYKGNDNYYLESSSDPANAPAAGATVGSADVAAYGTGPLPINTWSFLTESYNGTTIQLYINGVSVASKAQSGSLVTSTNQLQIGGDSIYGQYFQGLIDEVRVYNVALTAAEIQADMATPITPGTPPPTAPANLMATASGTTITLNWTGSADAIGVSNYLVERENPGSTSFVQIGTTTATTYSDTGLTVNSTYSYRVRAMDWAGNDSAYSNVVSATTQPPDTTPPTAPSNLTATAAGAGQINLSWTASTDNVDGVSGYFVERQNPGSSSFVQIGTTTATTYSDTGLANNSTYSYRVRASDTSGNLSGYSNVASATTPVGNPALVAAYAFDEGTGSTVADASGNGRTGTIVNATWSTAGKYGDALSFNGTNARVDIPDAAALHLTTGMTLEAWVNLSAAPHSWQDVIYKGNDNYYLESSSGPANAPVAGATVGSADVGAFGNATLPINTWSFLSETYDGTTIRLYVNGAQVASLAKSGSLATSANPLQIGGDSIYGQYFQGLIDEVRVYNVALTGAEIQADMATPIAPGTPPPTAPASLSATASGTTITLNWTGSADAIGVSGYLVERENPGSTSFVQIGTTTATTYSDTGLTVNSTYSYRVRAMDWNNDLSAYSNVVSATTQPPDTTPPTAPSNLTATAAGAGRINLSWTASTDNVDGVSGYFVERENPGSSSFVQIGTTTATTYSDTGLANNSTYSYRVRASDAAGNLSGYSNVASATTPVANPGLVAAYAFDAGTGTTVADASGNGHTGTIVNATWSTAGKYGDALSFNGTNARVDIPDAAALHLTTGMTLEAWVNPSAAGNGWQDVIYKGNDNYYLESSSTPNNAPVAGATVGSADVGAFSSAPLVTNSWTFLTETYDGTTIQLYVNGVQVAGLAQSGSLVTSTNPLQIGGDSIFGQFFQGLIDNVRIYNRALTAAQIQADINTPIAAGTPPPTAPTSLTATASGSTIILNWAASSDEIGVSYVVERENPGSSSFTQIGTTTRTTYSDTGLTDNSTYSYEVQALDWAGNLGTASSVASATAQFGISPHMVTLPVAQTQQFTANGAGVTWSVDGVAGGSAATGTITSAGLYTAPSSAGIHTVTGTSGSQSDSATVDVTTFAGTFTERNDNMRTGANLNETILTPSNVNSTQFGKLFSYPLDGIAFANPLYVPHVNIPGMGYHNVVYVATEHDSVYAFDADGMSTTPLWHVSFINPSAGVTPIPAADTGELNDIPIEVGITGTPVIDPTTGTIYLVADTKVVANGTTTYYQTLHALDITTGAEKFGGPVVIQATVPGTGSDSSNGMIPFSALYENQHSGLLLNNGVVYIAFSSHGSTGTAPYWHGWVFGYNASTLQQVMVYMDSANGNGAGIWMGADGLSSDSTGDIYFTTGNGTFDANTGGVDYGDSAVKISPSGQVVDYFTPYDQATMDSKDLDLASGGVLLLPTQSGPHPDEMVFGGKTGTVYVANRDNMGHYNSSNNKQIVQSLVNIFTTSDAGFTGNFSSPVYYNGYVYFGPVGGTVQAFKVTNGLLSTAPTSQSAESYPYPGGMIAISANVASNGILWAVQRNGTTSPGVLFAYDATNLAHELYNSNQAGSRDTMDLAAKFSMPTVANGKVYVGGVTQLTVYGLLSTGGGGGMSLMAPTVRPSNLQVHIKAPLKNAAPSGGSSMVAAGTLPTANESQITWPWSPATNASAPLDVSVNTVSSRQAPAAASSQDPALYLNLASAHAAPSPSAHLAALGLAHTQQSRASIDSGISWADDIVDQLARWRLAGGDR